MDDYILPDNLILDVLSRLPVKTIIKCKCVFKNWRDLVSDPYFVRLHLSRSREALMIHECPSIEYTKRTPGTLEWAEIEHEARNYHLDAVKILDLKLCPLPDRSQVYQVGSVNGLICFKIYSCIYIFNHVLEQYILLSQPQLYSPTFFTGFGVSTAGEYKVIRICQRQRTKLYVNPIEIEVYTLGTGQWRVLGPIPYLLNLSGTHGWTSWTPSVFVNNHVYWLFEAQIYAFDLTTETFELLPSPQAPGDMHEAKQILGVLKGRLSRVNWSSLGLEVWMMKDDDSWYKEIAIKDNTNFLLTRRAWRPLLLIDRIKGKGTSILLLRDLERKKLVAYCLKTNKVMRSSKLRAYILTIVTYHPSFVKLDEFRSEKVYAIGGSMVSV